MFETLHELLCRSAGANSSRPSPKSVFVMIRFLAVQSIGDRLEFPREITASNVFGITKPSIWALAWIMNAAKLCLSPVTGSVPSTIAWNSSREQMVMALFTSTFVFTPPTVVGEGEGSRYVPGATEHVSPGVAASTQAWMVDWFSGT